MWARSSLEHLEAIRREELDTIAALLPTTGRVLEVGAGAGYQTRALAERGYDVCAIDLPTSNLSAHRVWPIVEYNGVTVPFPDHSFDVVFSSNVLEHVPEVLAFQQELRRVLKPGGIAIHVVPSATWRFWTNVTSLLKRGYPSGRHGEHAGNELSEVYAFSQQVWRTLFDLGGWDEIHYQSNGLFYTGHCAMDSRWSPATRRMLARVLGGSCHVFVLRPRPGYSLAVATYHRNDVIAEPGDLRRPQAGDP